SGASPSPRATRPTGPQVPPVDDVGADPLSSQAETPPDVAQDIPVLAGQQVVATSTSATGDQELAVAPDPDLIQVSGYNGATSSLPYVLRVRATPTPGAPACPAYDRSGGTAGTLPNL